LIEVALPLSEINDASAYDKMPGIGPHPKGIHHWWARLPLPTARAILFASVVDDPSEDLERFPTEERQTQERERLFDIIRSLMQKKLHEHPEVYAAAKAEMLSQCAGRLPTVYDPFAGGGSIPLEASRMGFSAQAADLNPVAVLLNKCNLEIAPRWARCPPVNPTDRKQIGGTDSWPGTHGLAADVRYYSSRIRNQLSERVGHLYPNATSATHHNGVSVVAWIWARTVVSPNPAMHGKRVPLMSTFWLSSKANGQVWVDPSFDAHAADGLRFEIRFGTATKEQTAKFKLGTRAGKAQDFYCLLSNQPIPRDYVQAEGKAGRLGTTLVATVVEGKPRKTYVAATPEQLQAATASLDSPIPELARSTFLSGTLPDRANITGGVCSAYGINTWGQLFTNRQLIALVTLSDLITIVAKEVKADALRTGMAAGDADDYADTIQTFLALAQDRCADFNNSLCRWSPSNQKVMNLYARQALPMVWDYAEANLLGDSVGAWQTCSDYVADCVQVIAADEETGKARQLDAAAGVAGLSDILVSTDPPYYDNISYATLSDFFYLWLRRTLGSLYSETFSTLLVPKSQELTASPGRFGGDKLKAKEHFEAGFRSAFTAMRGKMDLRFPLTVYYAFKQDDESGDPEDEGPSADSVDLTTGWETLLEALVTSGFQVTGTWPIRASQKWRMVAMGTNALASYIVLACRPRATDAPLATRKEFMNGLRLELPTALKNLQHGNIAPVDMAQAAIGPGMAIFTRYAKVIESDGGAMSVRSALGIINQVLDEVLAEQEGDFDADTRWALAWFEQCGAGDGEFGIAETLSKAKNTSVNGLVEAGVVKAKSGMVRLLRRSELPADWNPATDKRLTVWEVTQHIIRTLESRGEVEAAALVNRLGGLAETSRELAYRLYSICERKKWADEALAYNSLVIAWPELTKLAAAQRNQVPQRQQQEMFQ
jgi:putative DNA methylase